MKHARKGRPDNTSTVIAAAPTKEGRLIVAGKAPDLPELTAAVKVEIAAWRELESKAAFRALRIGVLILKARATVAGDHGAFIAWCSENIGYSRMMIWRFCRAAETFLQQKRIPLDVAVAEIVPPLLVGPGADDKPKSEALQLAFDFLGDQSFSELCDTLGMPVRTVGGDTSQHRTYQAKPEDTAEAAERFAEDLLLHAVANLGELCKAKRIAAIRPATFHAAIRELRKRVQDLEERAKKEGLL